jgi:hypothetical protein
MRTDGDQVPGSVAEALRTAHASSGYGTSSAWLAAMTRLKAGDAKAAVAQMRTLARHPRLAAAMAAGAISPSWVNQLDRLTRKLPPSRGPRPPRSSWRLRRRGRR